MIVAMDEAGGIGLNNDLPWRLPNDLKYFKEVTSGQTVIMGRKTFESIGKPLPNRENIILTRDLEWIREGVTVFNDIEVLLEYLSRPENEVHEFFVIGGKEIFNQFYERATYFYVTHIHHTFETDIVLDSVNWDDWTLTSKTKGSIDSKNSYHHDFTIYERTSIEMEEVL